MRLFLVFCVLLLLVQLIIGICPNNCNSHGICGKNGVCQCYHQDITQLSPNSNEVYGYGGADCSEVLCPFGNPFIYTDGTSNYIMETGQDGDDRRRLLSEPVERNVVRMLAEPTVKITIESGGSNKDVYKVPSAGEYGYDKLACAEGALSCILSCTATDGSAAPITINVWMKFSSLAYIEYVAPATVADLTLYTCSLLSDNKNDFTNFKEILISDQPASAIVWEGYGKMLADAAVALPANAIPLWCYGSDGIVKVTTATITYTQNSDNADVNDLTITPQDSSSLLSGDKCHLMGKIDGTNIVDNIPTGSTDGVVGSGCDYCSNFVYYSDKWYVKDKICEIKLDTNVYSLIIGKDLISSISGNIITLPGTCYGAADLYDNMKKSIHVTTKVVISGKEFTVKSYEGTTITLDNSVGYISEGITIEISVLDSLTPIESDDNLKIYKVNLKYDALNDYIGGAITCRSGSNSVTGTYWGYNDVDKYSYISYDDESNKICKDAYASECTDGKYYPTDLDCLLSNADNGSKDFTGYKDLIVSKAADGAISIKSWTKYGEILKAFGLSSASYKIKCYHPEKNKENLLYDYEVKLSINDDVEFSLSKTDHLADGDKCMLMLKKDGSPITLTTPSGACPDSNPCQSSDECDKCGYFYYVKDRNQWFYNSPEMLCEIDDTVMDPSDNNKKIYTITIEASLSRLIINHYIDTSTGVVNSHSGKLELPSGCSNGDKDTAMFGILRKSGSIKIEIIGFGSDKFEDKDYHMIWSVKEINGRKYVTFRTEIKFEPIKYRLLQITEDAERLTMKITIKPAPVLNPISSNNGLNIYRIPLKHEVLKDSIKVVMKCESNGKVVNGTYWGYNDKLIPDTNVNPSNRILTTEEVKNAYTYMSFATNKEGDKICNDPYIGNKCDDFYPYDFDFTPYPKTEKKDLTDYNEIKISTINAESDIVEFNWEGFSEIVYANGLEYGNKENVKLRCYHSSKSNEYYGNLIEYSTTIKHNIVNFSEQSPKEENVVISIKNTDRTLMEGDICYILATKKGETIQLKEDNPVVEKETQCDICSTFYYDTIRKKYYIKDIYLNRIESDYIQLPGDKIIYTNYTVVYSNNRINETIDPYYNNSHYLLLKPTNKTANTELEKVVKPYNVMEITLSLPNDNKKDEARVVYKEITQIQTVYSTDEIPFYNLTIYPPFLPLRKEYQKLYNINDDAIILNHTVLPNSDCNYETQICKHYLLKLDLPTEGGNVAIIDNNNKETIGSGNVLSYKTTYPQVCFIQYSFSEEKAKEFYEQFSYAEYTYKTSSKRNDLSTYSQSIVEKVDENNYHIKWENYGKAIELMGLKDKEVPVTCYAPPTDDNSNVKITTMKYEATVTIENENDAVFKFLEHKPKEKDICHVTIKANGSYVPIEKSEAGTFFEKNDGGEVIYKEIKENTVDLSTTTSTKVDANTKEEITITNPVVTVGKSIFAKMREIQSEMENEPSVDPTQKPTIKPSENPDTSSSSPKYFPVPLPAENKETVSNSVAEDKWMKVELYDGPKKVMELTTKILSIIRTENDFIVVKTKPEIDLSSYKSRRQIRVLDGTNYIVKVIIEVTVPDADPTIPSTTPFLSELDFNREGGLLSCENMNQGSKGMVDITSYNKNISNMYSKYLFDVSPSNGDKLSCNPIFKRNDLSLYATSIVKFNDDKKKIVWEKYGNTFNNLISELPLPSSFNSFDFLCYNPNDASKNYKLTEYSLELQAINDNVTFYFDDNDVTPADDSICYCMNKVILGDDGNAKEVSKLNVKQLDAFKYFNYVNGELVFDIVDESIGSSGKITPEGPQMSLSVQESTELLKSFKDNKELKIKSSNDEAGVLFSMRIVPGSIIEIAVNGGLQQPITNKIATVASVKKDEEKYIYIKTIEEIVLPEVKNRRRILADADKISNPVVSVTVRSSNLKECSGQGKCNRDTGRCECYNGFTGSSCQRIDCPNNCNGNGRCVALNELLSNDELKDYRGYNSNANDGVKVYGCLCDKRHRGYDCSLIECPSGEDPEGVSNSNGSDYRDCSGRGICDYKTGICECFEGYYGEGCQIKKEFA